MVLNQSLRLMILQLVNQQACANCEPAEDTIKRAELYKRFIESNQLQDDVSEEAPPVIANAVEPGIRRKRRTKVEIGNLPESKLSMEAESGVPVTEVKVTLTDIQQAMIRVFERDAFGMEAVRDILDGLNVQSVSDLRPEQYRDCLDQLQEAIDGKPLV